MMSGRLICAYFVSICAAVIFVFFAKAIKSHFVSDRMPPQMLVVSALGTLNFGLSLWFGVLRGTIAQSFVALCLLGLSFWMFRAAIVASTAKDIGLAYAGDEPKHLIKTGIYRYVRHPFYLSYTLYWAGLTVFSFHLSTAILSAVLYGLYVVAAASEERQILSSSHGNEYAAYRDNTRAYLPPLHW